LRFKVGGGSWLGVTIIKKKISPPGSQGEKKKNFVPACLRKLRLIRSPPRRKNMTSGNYVNSEITTLRKGHPANTRKTHGKRSPGEKGGGGRKVQLKGRSRRYKGSTSRKQIRQFIVCGGGGDCKITPRRQRKKNCPRRRKKRGIFLTKLISR